METYRVKTVTSDILHLLGIYWFILRLTTHCTCKYSLLKVFSKNPEQTKYFIFSFHLFSCQNKQMQIFPISSLGAELLLIGVSGTLRIQQGQDFSFLFESSSFSYCSACAACREGDHCDAFLQAETRTSCLHLLDVPILCVLPSFQA